MSMIKQYYLYQYEILQYIIHGSWYRFQFGCTYSGTLYSRDIARMPEMLINLFEINIIVHFFKYN